MATVLSIAHIISDTGRITVAYLPLHSQHHLIELRTSLLKICISVEAKKASPKKASPKKASPKKAPAKKPTVTKRKKVDSESDGSDSDDFRPTKKKTTTAAKVC